MLFASVLLRKKHIPEKFRLFSFGTRKSAVDCLVSKLFVTGIASKEK